MLEGLEISEISCSQIHGENRFDSEFYQKFYVTNEAQLRKKPFFQITEKFYVTDGEHGSVIERDSGVKYLTAENVKNGYVDISSVRFVDGEVDKRNARARVAVDDVLISIKGTIGTVGVAEEWLLPANMNRDVAILKPLLEKNKSFVVAIFLMSKYGLMQSSRGGSGGVQQMITLERLRKFLVPLFSSDFDLALVKLFQTTQRLRKQSQLLYTKAEGLLLESLGLENFSPSSKNTNIKSFKDSFQTTNRLDAEYYQLKYEEINSHLKNYPSGFLPLNDLAETIRGIFVSEELYQDEGKIAYIRGADISSNKLEKDKLVYIDSFNDYDSKEKCQEGDIAFSLIGSVGTASIITKDLVGSLVSNNLGIIRVKDLSKIQPLVLHLFLTHKRVGGELFAQQEMRTAQPKISDKNIHGFPIPLIDPKTQSQISSLIQESFALKAKSEKLLEVAKKAVEMAIEESEEKAIKWIYQQTKNI